MNIKLFSLLKSIFVLFGFRLISKKKRKRGKIELAKVPTKWTIAKSLTCTFYSMNIYTYMQVCVSVGVRSTNTIALFNKMSGRKVFFSYISTRWLFATNGESSIMKNFSHRKTHICLFTTRILFLFYSFFFNFCTEFFSHCFIMVNCHWATMHKKRKRLYTQRQMQRCDGIQFEVEKNIQIKKRYKLYEKRGNSEYWVVNANEHCFNYNHNIFFYCRITHFVFHLYF